jgi:hypothetical protein
MVEVKPVLCALTSPLSDVVRGKVTVAHKIYFPLSPIEYVIVFISLKGRGTICYLFNIIFILPSDFSRYS